MSDSEVEEMLIELESEMLTLKLDDMLKLAQSMKLDESIVKDKSRLMILKAIRGAIEETLRNLTEKSQIVEYIESIKAFLGPPPLEGFTDEGEGSQKDVEVLEAEPQKETEVLELEEEIQNLLSKQKEIQGKLSEAQKKKGTGASRKSNTPPENMLKVPLASLEQSLLHRDFKIQGVVGEPGQKDKLGYQSLVSQIEAGVRKKYTEVEIVNAVVRAVQPGLQLRSYLESVSDLTLPRLRKIIRFHYHEKSATELYQTLANITQQVKEDPQSFLIRALTIRQKIIFASKESGNNITYAQSSVQGLFLHALETGLIDETIRANMRPALQNPLVTDEDLIEAMNMAMSAETERVNKFSFSGRKSANVSTIEKATDKNKEKREEGRVLAALKAVQTDVATMQSEMKFLHDAVTKKPEAANEMRNDATTRPGRPKRGCKGCEEQGMADTCSHCFLCGGANHIARYCKTKFKNQGNNKGLPPRDRE